MRRRFMTILEKQAKLIKLIDLGERIFVFERGYKYADLLIVGGGGSGGDNSGGGGGSGVILYAPNCLINRFNQREFSYNIADRQDYTSTKGYGNSTYITINGTTYEIKGGTKGGGSATRGGSGGSISLSSLQGIYNYMEDNSLFNATSCGGGCPGLWTESTKSGTNGGSGASLFSAGNDAWASKGGDPVEIQDGVGGYMGGSGYGHGYPGIGMKANTNVIPIKSLFGASGFSGSGSKSLPGASGCGGGAAGYGSGGSAATVMAGQGQDGGYGAGGGGGHGNNGKGGKGGQGIICIYYHN